MWLTTFRGTLYWYIAESQDYLFCLILCCNHRVESDVGAAETRETTLIERHYGPWNFKLRYMKSLVPEPETKLPSQIHRPITTEFREEFDKMSRPNKSSVSFTKVLFKTTWQGNDFQLSQAHETLGPMKPKGLAVAGLNSSCIDSPAQRQPQQGRRVEEVKRNVLKNIKHKTVGSLTSKASASS